MSDLMSDADAALEKLRSLSVSLGSQPPSSSNLEDNRGDYSNALISMSRRASSLTLPSSPLSLIGSSTVATIGNVTESAEDAQKDSSTLSDVRTTLSSQSDSSCEDSTPAMLTDQGSVDALELEPSERLNPSVRRALGLKNRQLSITGMQNSSTQPLSPIASTRESHESTFQDQIQNEIDRSGSPKPLVKSSEESAQIVSLKSHEDTHESSPYISSSSSSTTNSLLPAVVDVPDVTTRNIGTSTTTSAITTTTIHTIPVSVFEDMNAPATDLEKSVLFTQPSLHSSSMSATSHSQAGSNPNSPGTSTTSKLGSIDREKPVDERVDAPSWFNNVQSPPKMVKKMNLHPFLGVEVVPVSVPAFKRDFSLTDENQVNSKVSPLVSVAQSLLESHDVAVLTTSSTENKGEFDEDMHDNEEQVDLERETIQAPLTSVRISTTPSDIDLLKKRGNATIAMSLGSLSPNPRLSTSPTRNDQTRSTSPTRNDRTRSPLPSSWPDMQVFPRNPNIIADEAHARIKDARDRGNSSTRPSTVYDRLTSSPKKVSSSINVNKETQGFKYLHPPASAASSLLDPSFAMERIHSGTLSSLNDVSMSSSQVIKTRPFVAAGRTPTVRPSITAQVASNARKVLSPSEWSDLTNRLSSPQQKAKREPVRDSQIVAQGDVEANLNNGVTMNNTFQHTELPSMSSRSLNPYAFENQSSFVSLSPSASAVLDGHSSTMDSSVPPSTAASSSKRSRRSPGRRTREETARKRAEKERLKEEQRRFAASAAAQGMPFTAFGSPLRLNTDAPNSNFSFQFPSPSGGFMPLSPSSQQVNIASLSPGFQARLAEITKNLSSPTSNVSNPFGGNISPNNSVMNPFGGPLSPRPSQIEPRDEPSQTMQVQSESFDSSEDLKKEDGSVSQSLELNEAERAKEDDLTNKNEDIAVQRTEDSTTTAPESSQLGDSIHQEADHSSQEEVPSRLQSHEGHDQPDPPPSSLSPTTSFYAKMISDQYKGLTERILASISGGSPSIFPQALDPERLATVSISSMYSSGRSGSLPSGGLVVAGVPAMTIRAYSRQGGSRLGSRNKSRAGRPTTVSSKQSMTAKAAYSQTQSLIESPTGQSRAMSPGKEKRPLGSGLGIAIRPTFDPFAPATLLQEQDAYAPPSVRVQPSQLPNTLTISSPEHTSRLTATQWLEKHSPSAPSSAIAPAVTTMLESKRSISSDSPFLNYKSILGVVAKSDGAGAKARGRISGSTTSLKDFLSRPINENLDQFLNRTQELIASANGVPFTEKVTKSTIVPPTKEPTLKQKATNVKKSSSMSKPPRTLNGAGNSHLSKDSLQQGTSVLTPPVFFSSIASNKPPVSKFVSDLDEAASLAQALLSGSEAPSPAPSLLLQRPSIVSSKNSSNLEAGFRASTSVQVPTIQSAPLFNETVAVKDEIKVPQVIAEDQQQNTETTPSEAPDSTIDSFSQFPSFTMSGPYVEGSSLDGDDEVLGLHSNNGVSSLLMNRPNSRSVSQSQRGFSMLIPSYTPTRGSSPTDSPDKEGADTDDNSSRGGKSRPVTVPVEVLAQLLANDVSDMSTVGDSQMFASRPNTTSRPNTQQRSSSRMTQHRASKSGNPYKVSVV
jgi:hypothetical protein